MAAPRIGAHRIVATASLAALHGVLVLAYAVPVLAKGAAPATSGNRVSIVSYIDDLGPVWQLGFGLTGLALLAGLVWPKALATAHAVSAGVTTVFATALWVGYYLSDPRPAVLSAAAYTALAAWHVSQVLAYGRPTSARAVRMVIPTSAQLADELGEDPSERPRGRHRGER